MRQKCLLIISEKIKKIRGETTSPYKFINENHTYITCLFKKKGKRKGKEITRPILSSNSRDAIRRDSSVNEWKINTTIVAVDSSKEKGEEKKREREKRRKIAIDRSRCAVAVKSTGKLPARARPAELFFKRDRNSRRRKKRPGDGGEFREIRTPPLSLKTRTEDARTRSVAGGDRATTKKNIRLIHFRSPVAVCTFFFFIFRFIIPSFILDPDEAAIEKSTLSSTATLSPKCFFFTLFLSLSAPSTS